MSEIEIDNLFDVIGKNRYDDFISLVKEDPKLMHSEQRYSGRYQNTLYCAVSHNCYEISEYLLKHGVIQSTYFSDTPLHISAKHGNCELFDLLLLHGANPFIFDVPKKETLTFTAGMSCGCGEVKHPEPQILKIESLSYHPILHSAVHGTNPLIIDKLLQIKCDIEIQDRDHLTPLLHACKTSNLATVKFLIDQGANPTPKISTNILDICIKTNNIELVKYILNYVTLEMICGTEQLSYDNLDIAMLFLPKLDFKYQSLNILHYYSYIGNLNMIREVISLEFNKDMIYKSNANYGTAVHIAIRQGYIFIVKYFIETTFMVIDELMFRTAIKYKQKIVFEYLVSKGDITKHSDLICEAIRIEDLDIIKTFYRKGCFAYMNCESVIQSAWNSDNYNVLKFFLEHGVSPNIQRQSLLFNYYGSKCEINNAKLLMDFGVNIWKTGYRGETIIENLIDRMEFNMTKYQFELLILLLSENKLRYNLDKFKTQLSTFTKIKIYHIQEPDYPAIEDHIQTGINHNTFIPQIRQILERNHECEICMEYNSNFTIPNCHHTIVCSECIKIITKCPQCLSDIN